jgi:hypothetical protein
MGTIEGGRDLRAPMEAPAELSAAGVVLTSPKAAAVLG